MWVPGRPRVTTRTSRAPRLAGPGLPPRDAPMSSQRSPLLPPVNAEHRRIAATQFDRANQVVASGNYDYGIQLLISCCTLDPANLLYRQALRRTEKAKYGNNLQGSRL